MAKYQFGDSENRKSEIIPEGNYILEVVGVEFGLTRERGDDKMELELKVDGKDCRIYETLTFTPKVEWKIDTFVKSCNLLIDGRSPKKGEAIDFSEELVIGLRGWATVFVDEYTPKNSADGKKKKINKVRTWLTDKEKLPRREYEKVEETTEDFPDDSNDDVPF